MFRAEFRRRWRTWLALAVLVALVGGVVLAAAAAGRRTEAAFPRYVAHYGFDAAVYFDGPVPQLTTLSDVKSVTAVFGVDNGQPTCACSVPIDPTDFGVLTVAPGSPPFSKLVAGHMPDPSSPYDVVAAFTLEHNGVHLGSVIHVPMYAAAQKTAYNDAVGALPTPTGPDGAFRVVGFEASEFEFPSGQTPSYDLFTTPAFARTVLPRIAYGQVDFVRLRHGAADLPRFESEASAKGADAENQDEILASVEASIHPQAIGWWLLAGLALLIGLAVVGQALLRQSTAEAEDYPTLATLGAERRQLVMLGMARTVVVGLAGAAGALLIAAALSPVAPLGEARVAETGTGVSVDTLVLPLGALGIVVVVLALGLWPAVRAARVRPADVQASAPRPSAIVSQLAAMGAPPSAVVGVRNALERRSGGGTVPVGTALLGTVLAVVALCGTTVFGASLSHLTATPRLYGDAFALDVTNPGPDGPDPAVLDSLEHDKAVTGITEGFAFEISIDHTPVGAIAGEALRGEMPLSTVTGHLPDKDAQIGLGGATMHRANAHIGSLVSVAMTAPSGRTRTATFRVVSQISFPVLGGAVGLGTGAAFTLSAYRDAVCPPGPGRAACLQPAGPLPGGLLVSVAQGAAGKAAATHFLDANAAITSEPPTPTSLVNFGEAVNFPLIFGLLLAVSGAATLVHLLVVSVARRRREVGLLKAVGFVNSQVASAVAWQAVTLALIGVVIGVPVGIVVGRQVWLAFADNLGAVPVAVVQAWLVVVVAVGVILGALVLAVAPALVATRSHPSDLLRTQ
jgi:hypothetical protein